MGSRISLKEAYRRVREAKTFADIEALFRDAFGAQVFADEGAEAVIIKEKLGVIQGTPIYLTDAAKGANPNFKRGGGYVKNCQRCVVVYELRRRGYDVIALPKTVSAKYDGIFSTQDCFKNPVIIGARSNIDPKPLNQKELINQLEGLPAGARASICWTRAKRKGGHTIVCEKMGSQLVFVDPQTGHIGQHVLGDANQDGYSYFRMDNLEVDETKLLMVASGKGV